MLLVKENPYRSLAFTGYLGYFLVTQTVYELKDDHLFLIVVKAGDRLITGPFRTLKKLKDGMAIVETAETSRASKKKDKDED